jgi:hypothetical protein
MFAISNFTVLAGISMPYGLCTQTGKSGASGSIKISSLFANDPDKPKDV